MYACMFVHLACAYDYRNLYNSLRIPRDYAQPYTCDALSVLFAGIIVILYISLVIVVWLRSIGRENQSGPK